MLHILAKRGWGEYGVHNWDRYEELCRTSVKLAKLFPKEKGIDLFNYHGQSPLMSAVSSGNDVMAFELVRAKCDVNAVWKVHGKADRTAMDMAACAKRTDLIELLKRHGGFGLCEPDKKGRSFAKKRSRRR